mmetsp:Transcript_9524/g.32444  ORF Transcript_9524/g.32444 Transcript_9524/m.32444 type:complete len:291 (-) Transcript_9524:81-953(-)
MSKTKSPAEYGVSSGPEMTARSASMRSPWVRSHTVEPQLTGRALERSACSCASRLTRALTKAVLACCTSLHEYAYPARSSSSTYCSCFMQRTYTSCSDTLPGAAAWRGDTRRPPSPASRSAASRAAVTSSTVRTSWSMSSLLSSAAAAASTACACRAASARECAASCGWDWPSWACAPPAEEAARADAPTPPSCRARCRGRWPRLSRAPPSSAPPRLATSASPTLLVMRRYTLTRPRSLVTSWPMPSSWFSSGRRSRRILRDWANTAMICRQHRYVSRCRSMSRRDSLLR